MMSSVTQHQDVLAKEGKQNAAVKNGNGKLFGNGRLREVG